MLNDFPRQKLRELVVSLGNSTYLNQQKCRGLLLDVCGQYRKEITLLMAAVEERIPDELEKYGHGAPIEALLKRLTKRLSEARALNEEGAAWAVDSWALAIGVISSAPHRTSLTTAHNVSPWSLQTILLLAVGGGVLVIIGILMGYSAGVSSQARSRATTATAGATAAAIASQSSSLAEKFTSLYGPTSASIFHDDKAVTRHQAEVKVTNFKADSKFYNPYPTTQGSWDYGFYFAIGPDAFYDIAITSDKTWFLYLDQFANQSWQGKTLDSGKIDELDTSSGGSNTLRLIVDQSTGILYVNNRLVASLNLSAKATSGDVAVATGIIKGHSIAGKVTRYEGFSIASEESSLQALLASRRASSKVEVSSQQGWQSYDVYVVAGNAVSITQVGGAWSECGAYGCPGTDANGSTRFGLNYPDSVLGSCLHSALIARISNNDPFCVGAKYSGRVTQSGKLEMRINDKVITDNTGKISVQVEIR